MLDKKLRHPDLGFELCKGTSFAFFGTRSRLPRELWARNIPEINARKDERDKEEGYIEAMWERFGTTNLHSSIAVHKNISKKKRWISTSTFVGSLATLAAVENL